MDTDTHEQRTKLVLLGFDNTNVNVGGRSIHSRSGLIIFC